jgi:heterodisulfide reductase subunit A
VEETFDLVVLSIGIGVPKDAVDLAKKLGIHLNPYYFTSTSSFEPVRTSRPGVFVCGAFQAPKDIPDSVIQASGAAAGALVTLGEARGTLIRKKEYPPEREVTAEEAPRIGAFICSCGTNIAGTVDVKEVTEFAKSLPGVVHTENTIYTCSADSLHLIQERVKELNLNRVIVASCTPKTHEPLFRDTIREVGLNPYLFEMANIRDQCSWVHMNLKEQATEKAKELVRMAVACSRNLEPLHQMPRSLNHSCLIVGGGLAGMVGALSMAGQGYHTYLIEKSDALGGQARNLHQTWRGEDVQQYLNKLVQEVQLDPRIEVYLSTELKEVEGSVGNFKSTVQTNGTEKVLEHGVAIIATGASELKPDQHLYGQDPRVLTSLELDRKVIDRDVSLKSLRSVAFIQCVGSRIKERPYCSKVCCTHSVLSALKLKEMNPDMDVFIVYRDMRTYALREDLYREARAKGVVFIRYDDQKELKVTQDQEDLQVLFTSYVLNREVEIRPDLLVLATAIVPPKENPVAKLFKVPVNSDGFFVEAHVKLRPIDFATDGVFVCGLAHSPKPIDESIAHGLGASARAATILSQEMLQVGGVVAVVEGERCAACLTCVRVCPYNVPVINAKGEAEIDPAKCKGCGGCVAECPAMAIELMHFKEKQLEAKCEALVYNIAQSAT